MDMSEALSGGMDNPVSEILRRASSGELASVEELYPILYDDLRRRARLIMQREGRRHTLQPTALVNESYMKLADQNDLQWNDKAHFLAIAARAMRQVLVDHARAKKRLKRGGNNVRLTLNEQHDAPDESTNIVDLLDIEESIVQIASLDARKGQVCELKLFGDMTFKEIGEVLGISQKTAEADWYFSRAWLRRQLR